MAGLPDRQRITSIDNASVRRAVSLRRPGAASETGLFLIEGLRFVSDALERLPHAVSEVFVSEEALPLLEGMNLEGVRVLVLASGVFGKLSGTVHSQGVAAVCRVPVADPGAIGGAAGRSTVLVLDGISDPGNTGTLVRSAAAFGCAAVVLTAGSCDPFAQKAARASAGANILVPVLTGMEPKEVAHLLKQRGYMILASDAGGPSYSGSEQPERTALVVGAEAAGVSPVLRALCDGTVSIPMSPCVESLNAAVAGSILLAWLQNPLRF
jgi:RNA methyltransferase, TrmH family